MSRRKITLTAKETVNNLWDTASEKNIIRKQSDVDFSPTQYERKLSEKGKSYIPSDFVILEANLLKTLDTALLKIIMEIIANLRQNNALWYVDYKNLPDRSQRAVNQLIKEDVIFATESIDIYIVNPFKIRKGNDFTVIAATSKLLEKTKVLSKELIRPLEAPKNVKRIPFND